jgi:WD40 repeat protein
VKALLSINIKGAELLISASSDATIIVWDVKSGSKLHTLKGHSRGVTALALESQASENDTGSVTIFSGDSNREIRRWSVSVASSYEIPTDTTTEDAKGGPITALLAHETSIYAIKFDTDGDLWTASADKTSQCLVRERAWKPDTILQHPDFVRDIVVDENGGWVITACRDEEVRVWERSSGKLFHTFSGHFEEVTGLLLLPGQLVVSVSIDGTVRRWSLKGEDLVKAKEEALNPPAEEEEEKPKGSALTAEEEAELAELMDSD